MVTSYSFDDGKKLGGTIVFSEQEQLFDSRKRSYRNDKIISIISIISISLFLLVLIVYLHFNFGLMIILLGLVIVGIMMGLIGYYFSSYFLINATPAMIFKDGFSTGMDERPFYKFSDVLYLIKDVGRGGASWHIKLSDGRSTLIPNFFLADFMKYTADRFEPPDNEGKRLFKKE